MKSPFVRRSNRCSPLRREERGVTIVLVALTMVAILAMAALSIDVVTLYLASAEAQRSADAAALAGARILSITGMTGDPNNTGGRWQPACDFAAKVATAVAEQDIVGGNAPTGAGQVTVTFPNNSDPVTCTGDTAAFGVNPLVTVKVQNANLPTFFARIWGQTGASVSATATAEAFNSSNSDTVGNGGPTGAVTPVQPRCVKPWIVPNSNPLNSACTPATCPKFVDPTDGSIVSRGIRLNGVGASAVGESFDLIPDCNIGGGACSIPPGHNPPRANANPSPPNLEYLPGEAPSSSTAVPSCAASGSAYEAAVAGCDQTTVYQCGIKSISASPPNRVDLTENPAAGDTSNGVQCLINQASGGQDTLDTSVYPYHFLVGAANPLVTSGGLATGSITTSSPSIVSFPIYDTKSVNAGGPTDVTIVGFLQVFIVLDKGSGTVNVTVLNVTGCGDGTKAVGTAVSGTSPVPVRLITYP
jgi:Flp pilus assembly protein TadG